MLTVYSSVHNGTNKGVLNPQSNHCLSVKQKLGLGVFAPLCFLLRFVWSMFFRKNKNKTLKSQLTKKPVSVICARVCVRVCIRFSFSDSAVLLCCTYTGMALNAFLLCLTYSATCIRYRTVLGKHPHTITSTNIQYLAQPLSKATYYIHCCLVFQWKHQRSLIVHKTGPV